MFDIGFFELLLIGVVGLLVVGPERLPDAIRTTARWWSGIKRTLHNAREELEKEVGADDIRRELHNERIMRELEESRREMEQAFSEAEAELAGTAESASEKLQESAPQAEAPFDPSHPTDDAEDYLPEQDEDAEELQDPEYPEHWHDYGDPDLNPEHPERVTKEERPPEEPPQEKNSQS